MEAGLDYNALQLRDGKVIQFPHYIAITNNLSLTTQSSPSPRDGGSPTKMLHLPSSSKSSKVGDRPRKVTCKIHKFPI